MIFISYQAFAIGLSTLGVLVWLVITAIAVAQARHASWHSIVRTIFGPMATAFLVVALLTLVSALTLDWPPDERSLVGRLVMSFIRGVLLAVGGSLLLVFWYGRTSLR